MTTPLSEALETLNETEAEMIAQHYDCGLSVQEMSDLAGVSVDAIKKRLKGAMRKIRAAVPVSSLGRGL